MCHCNEVCPYIIYPRDKASFGDPECPQCHTTYDDLDAQHDGFANDAVRKEAEAVEESKKEKALHFDRGLCINPDVISTAACATVVASYSDRPQTLTQTSLNRRIL